MIAKLKDFSPKIISDSGQCFRMFECTDGSYELVAFDRLLRIRQLTDTEFDFDCDSSDFDNIWRSYFDLDTDYDELLSFVDKNDTYLQNAIHFGRGMKLLRQEPFEMLISFIISQRKSIPAIRKCVEALSALAGKYIGQSASEHTKVYSFPTADSLVRLSDEELKSCMLGYRAPYVRVNASDVADKSLDLTALSELDSEALVARLMKQHGVGIKVASCVALFGYYKIDIFPIDVWIRRILDREYQGQYPPDGCSEISGYRKYAGILQQYMFYYERLGF